ncbi:hypothetical protein L484_007327 [Morus notabilis]|uniref:Uncharacterized protein n=1 Tax=Morus notabilis TaxID=981085 RepID=W9RMK0_9ROSA|nr:hypothetical protein L484_007327 [Morus notabilis]
MIEPPSRGETPGRGVTTPSGKGVTTPLSKVSFMMNPHSRGMIIPSSRGRSWGNLLVEVKALSSDVTTILGRFLLNWIPSKASGSPKVTKFEPTEEQGRSPWRFPKREVQLQRLRYRRRQRKGKEQEKRRQGRGVGRELLLLHGTTRVADQCRRTKRCRTKFPVLKGDPNDADAAPKIGG